MSNLTIEKGDRFLGSVLAGSTNWLTCDGINSVLGGPWWATGLDAEGRRGGGYIHELAFVWKAGEAVPRNTLNGEPVTDFDFNWAPGAKTHAHD